MFLVTLPLGVGVAVASGAPPISGVLAGIVGGVVVGLLSGSQTSVSGPAAGLIAVVATQITALGTFEAFLLAVVLAGVLQIALGIARAGSIGAFIPSGVIKGLLAAIGVILVLKQIPHLLGHDTDLEGEMSFQQPDHKNTFSELLSIGSAFHVGTALIGLASVALLVLWGRSRTAQRLRIPAPLVVVAFGVIVGLIYERIGGAWVIGRTHLVQLPIAESWHAIAGLLHTPDVSALSNLAVYRAALLIAFVASFESLVNLEAIDKLDPERRSSPANRELIAQGAGNIACGLVGGLPVTTLIIRSAVGVHAGARTKLATIAHGGLILVGVLAVPTWLNRIPLSALAAILLVTGCKLASSSVIRALWAQGRSQFLPFAATVLAIVFTDLLTGILVGMAISTAFILHSNLRRPLRRIVEKHVAGDVLRIELGNQVSFLNRASLVQALDAVPRGGQALIDATHTDYIDPDVLSLIADYRDSRAPAHGVKLSLVGFKERYQLEDDIQFVDWTSRDVQELMGPDEVLQILRDGNTRFRTGNRLTRDLGRQVGSTAAGQFPLAVVLSCIDSRTPVELIMDLGLGDVFSVRVAGNVVSPKVLGSMEYGCAVAGARLALVLGHTRCGAVTSSIDLMAASRTATEATGCTNLDSLVAEIQKSIRRDDPRFATMSDADAKRAFADAVAYDHVLNTIEAIRQESPTLRRLEHEDRLAIVGGLYDVTSGEIQFFCPLPREQGEGAPQQVHVALES